MAEQLHVWMLGISFFLFKAALAGHIAKNVALRSPAFQSSEPDANLIGEPDDTVDGVVSAPVPAAARAVDGNRDAAQTSTCTVTKSESGPWWMVDLQQEYKIEAIAVTSLDATLDGVEIWLGVSERLNDSRNIRCAVISSFPNKCTLYVPCGGLGGRYVAVLLPGDSRVLSLCEVEVYPVQFEYPLPNVALKGVASQSSALQFPDASKAIDGRRDSFYANGRCSHTALETPDPWWQVDLRRTFIITSVKVTNRGDCCADRLDGAEIRIGNAAENNGTRNPRCASITHIKAGKTATFHCDGGSMAGRFVNIIIPGTRETLTLCEVEVYGVVEETPLQNVALNKMVRWAYLGRYIPVSECPATEPLYSGGDILTNRWGKLDLLAVYKVRAVTIINPPKTFTKIEIFIKETDNWVDSASSRCVAAAALQETQTHTFHCGHMVGRYVQIVFPSSAMSMCDVEVYASPAAKEPESAETDPTVAPPAPPSESTLLNGRNVTLVGERICWSDALLYCRRRHWDLLSLHSEEEQEQVVQMLSRSTFAITDGVWLGLRRSVMGKMWFWMSGDSVDFSHWSPRSTPLQYSSPCGSMDVGEDHWWAARSCKEHLHFLCQSGGAVGPEKVLFHSYSTAGPG